jgi:uncharacterized membrane protein YcgQ (UPF0703/DUF1980 family)
LNIKRLILLLIAAKLTILGLYSQSRSFSVAQKNAEKKEQLQKKYYQKFRKFMVKERIKMQDENTQKRMAEARKRAREFNKRHNDIFFIRFIKKRKIKH